MVDVAAGQSNGAQEYGGCLAISLPPPHIYPTGRTKGRPSPPTHVQDIPPWRSLQAFFLSHLRARQVSALVWYWRDLALGRKGTATDQNKKQGVLHTISWLHVWRRRLCACLERWVEGCRAHLRLAPRAKGAMTFITYYQAHVLIH